jgi:S-DNA-T family DNA segregation ATPase FtsK/SpoIIIE
MDTSPRAVNCVCAAFLFFFALIISFSLSSSLFGVPLRTSPVGDFFADSYGVLSFIIPAYLGFASFILLDKNFRPRLIVMLNGIIFPFLTLAIGFSFLRDFGNYTARFFFLAAIGRNGFSLIVVTLTMLECFVIYTLAGLFFPETPRRRREPSRPETQSTAAQNNEVTLLRIPHKIAPETLKEVRVEMITPVEPSIADVKQAYTTAFERLDTLNSKLEHLSTDMESIDAQCTTLDSKIETLQEGFKEVENAQHREVPSPLQERQVRRDESVRQGNAAEAEFEELEQDYIDEPFFSKEGSVDMPDEKLRDTRMDIYSLSDDIEEVIEAAEEEARRKTEDVLHTAYHENIPQKKKLTGPGDYRVPVEGILDEASTAHYWIIDDTTKNAARILTETLREFNIEAEVTGIRKGPVITSFEILPSPGVKLSKIVNLQDNIALRLAAASVRIVAPIPGKHAVGIEIPNKERSIVSFREIIESELQKSKETARKAAIPVVLGKDSTGEAVTVDLATMPHLLIAGSTGSGKSVCVNAMILSILYQCPPTNCKLILIDPKIVELKLYNDIPHLLTPVITEPKRAFQALQYCIYEMERRYACLDSLGVRDIKTYNKRIKERRIAAEHMPYIVVVIDEFADLMATTGKELESTVARLAAMSRAVGIHLVLATQRPSIDVITGLIKSNIPSRIAFMVASMMDSRIIIDTPGAEKLLGKGDMLYSGIVDPFPLRMQGAFVSEDEVERVVDYVRSLGEPDYIDEEMFMDDTDDAGAVSEYPEGCDPLYEKAMEIVVQQGKASASYIQRRLKIGYNRAARLVEEMEQRGVVGPAQGSRPRELLRAV